MNRLSAIAQANKGYSCYSLKLLYSGMIVPILTYGCEFWGTELNKRYGREILLKAQRTIIIRINKAYQTISREANLVIAGTPPIDLVIHEKIKRRKDKENNINYHDSKRRRRDELMAAWQDRWTHSPKGRSTYAYLPSIRHRINMTFKQANHYTTQFLSGHGNFLGKLHTFGLTNQSLCNTCNTLEDADHVLFECPRYLPA